MKGIYKFDFFRYFKSLFYSPRQKTTNWGAIVVFYLLMFGGGLNATINLNPAGAVIAFVSSIVFLAAALIGLYCNMTPNPSSLLPMSSRKKLAYRYLSSLLFALIMLLAIIAVIIVMALLIFLITLAFEGGYVDDGAEDAGTSVIFPTGVYGGIFGAAYFVICYSAGMLSGFLKRRKYNNIFIVVFFFALIIAEVLMSIPYSASMPAEAGFVSVSPFSEACYLAMSAPWLCVLIWWLIAAAMLGASVYLGLKITDPKKY